ncbi:UNKNOWN [Stylonychia lemnae]|uniref:Uncharacterized protein n=1 Tax=Stylonychia lemnae TaxID=5949 RepID=A0A078A1I4_STYLE|nr:UNKNOWN [Stylonychia lemnae]|eukprot:CDW74644.1 UNKNOWN [Stylonychia lemnae]
MVITNDLSRYETFWEDVYMCQNVYDCLNKYVIGGISLIFVALYSQAIKRIKKKNSVDLDVRDKLLLSIALTESIFALLYHIFFEQYILLFIIRIVKMLEQVTICFILVELTLQNLPLMKSFWITLGSCVLAIIVMIAVVIYKNTYEFLYEKSFIWIIISIFQSVISVVTFLLTCILIKKDPQWQSENSKNQFKLIMRRSSVDLKSNRQLLDFSLESYMPPPVNQNPFHNRQSSAVNLSNPGQDVKKQFKRVYQEQLVIRRSKLFLLMITSVSTIAIMMILDIYVYVFLQNQHGHNFQIYVTIIIITGRVLQYHSVNLFFYFFLYWPYRRTFQPKQANYDVSYISELEVNDISIIQKKETLVGLELQKNISESNPHVVNHNNHKQKTNMYGKTNIETDNSYAL